MPENTAHPLSGETPPEADLLFSTARVRMMEEQADRIRAAVQKEVDWIRLIQLALQHETTALLYWNLRRVCPESVPPGVLAPLAARFAVHAKEVRRRAEELVRVLGALENEGIFAVAYKGPLLAQRVYGDMSLREFSERSDLDIVVHERDLLKARDVILRQGYRFAYYQWPRWNEFVRTQRELHFLREGDRPRLLELQWRFMVRAARVREDPERFLQHLETVSLAGSRVRSLPLEVYLFVLSLHAAKHKWRKLKLICDIGEILRSPGVDWGYILREADTLGLRRMLAIGVLLAEDPLGITAPAELTRRLRIDRTARALATERRQALLQPPDQNWLKEAEYSYLMQCRERLRDRATIYLKDRLLPRITPDERDRRLVLLPQSLSALYYFVRPARMVWEKITEQLQAFRSAPA